MNLARDGGNICPTGSTENNGFPKDFDVTALRDIRKGVEEHVMTQTLNAVFEDGRFKPVDNGSLPFVEGQRVKLTVEIPTETQGDLLGLAGQVYEGLSDKDIDEVESIALDRSLFFHDRPIS